MEHAAKADTDTHKHQPKQIWSSADVQGCFNKAPCLTGKRSMTSLAVALTSFPFQCLIKDKSHSLTTPEHQQEPMKFSI